jgi:calmodulin
MNDNFIYNIKAYLPQEYIDVAGNVFKKFDKGAKGAIETKDLGTMLRIMGFNPTELEVWKMIYSLEEDISQPKGLMTKEGFLVCVAQKKRDTDTYEELLNAFKVFDPENKGVIEEKYLRYILCKLGERGLTDEEMDLFMKEANQNCVLIQDDTKFIKYPEFAKHLKDL